MSMPKTNLPLSLIRHPATPAPVVSSIDAHVTFRQDGGISFFYCLRGDMARLRIPEEASSERTDLLWEHTCFEAFIGVCGETAYREFNFSPSNQWASYVFADYRQRAEEMEENTRPRPPSIITRRTEGRLELDACIDADWLPKKPDNIGNYAWEIGLSAVVETKDTIDGSHSYWALKHPTPRPDFHHRAAFTLKVLR